MGRERRIDVTIAGDASRLKKSFGQAEKAGGSFGKSIGKAGVLAGAAATGGVLLLAGGLAKAVTEARESAKIGRLTEQVIKTTGGAAKVTAGHVGDLAQNLSNMTGIDDEAIQGGANLLLTFTNLRNEAGKGNDVFDQTVGLANDMSVALGTDMKSASMQLGKALNDPVKGVGKLMKAGVSFTDQQKEQIKTLQESGDILGAQKVILGEVGKEFGGAAAAASDPMQKLTTVVNNLFEDLGTSLLPIITEIATWLGVNLPIAIEATKVAFQAVADWVRANWPAIKNVIASVMAGIEATIGEVVARIQWLWANFGNNIMAFVQRVWPRIQQIIQGVMETIRGIIKFVTALIRGDWGAAWDGIKQAFSGVWTAIQGILGAALEHLRLVLGIGLEVIGTLFKSAWAGIVDFFKGVPAFLAAAGSGMFDWIITAFKTAINWVIRGWNAIEFKIPGFDPPGPGPKFGGFTLGLPDIPQLAAGGITSGPTLAMLGDNRSGREAIIPLDDPRARSMVGGTTIVKVYLDGREVAGHLTKTIRRHDMARS